MCAQTGWSLRRHARSGSGLLWSFFLSLLILVGGCVSTPPVSLDAPLPSQWRNAVDIDAEADAAWWKAFDDRRLDALVDEAMQGNLDVAQAAERLQAARLLDRHSVDPFLPNLRARTDDAVDPDASASFFIAGFDSLWEFGLFGQRSSAERVARAQLDTATAGLRAARASLVAEVVRNWIELRSAQAQERALLGARESRSERLRLLRVRQSMDLASVREVAEGEAELAGADAHAFAQRVPGIVMVARFSRQKDHATLLRAVALLVARGLHPPVLLAGGGRVAHREETEALVNALGLCDQVRFLGVCRNVPDLLMRHAIAVLSTHHEGMPLALLEGMAAGCAVVGSDVEGVREILRDGENGRLVAARNPVALADALETLLTHPVAAARLAAAARSEALTLYAMERMQARYERLFVELARGVGEAARASNASPAGFAR